MPNNLQHDRDTWYFRLFSKIKTFFSSEESSLSQAGIAKRTEEKALRTRAQLEDIQALNAHMQEEQQKDLGQQLKEASKHQTRELSREKRKALELEKLRVERKEERAYQARRAQRHAKQVITPALTSPSLTPTRGTPTTETTLTPTTSIPPKRPLRPRG